MFMLIFLEMYSIYERVRADATSLWYKEGICCLKSWKEVALYMAVCNKKPVILQHHIPSRFNQIYNLCSHVKPWYHHECVLTPNLNILLLPPGGRQGKMPVTALEAFDLETKSWTRYPCIPSRRAFCCCATNERSLFSLGGLQQPGPHNFYSRPHFVSTMEEYDLEQGKQWPTNTISCHIKLLLFRQALKGRLPEYRELSRWAATQVRLMQWNRKHSQKQGQGDWLSELTNPIWFMVTDMAGYHGSAWPPPLSDTEKCIYLWLTASVIHLSFLHFYVAAVRSALNSNCVPLFVLCINAWAVFVGALLLVCCGRLEQYYIERCFCCFVRLTTTLLWILT